jgi:hypothetical protein
MSCTVAYILIGGKRLHRHLKRGVFYMHDKRVQNELFTLEYVVE